MSGWPGKFVIGLTGNIATGKSVIRRMLEHLGAYTIDADALAHRAIAQGSPGYQQVIEQFGRWILDKDEQVDRAKLGRIVFADPQALVNLENIVHPLVRQAVDLLVRRSTQKVIVIEAIKLLEGDLRSFCDVVWVTVAPYEAQLARLTRKRRMSVVDARQRIQAQGSQDQKAAAADLVIQNNDSFEHAWKQVVAGWQRIFPAVEAEAEEAEPELAGVLGVKRAGPAQAADIAALITRLSDESRRMTRDDVMEAFGEKAYMLLTRDKKLVGLVGWQVENLVARLDDFYLQPDLSIEDSARVLLGEVERASRELQCEAALLFLPPRLAAKDSIWKSLGYSPRTIEQLGVRAWQDAALESMPAGMEMLFIQLRKDRVMRPV